MMRIATVVFSASMFTWALPPLVHAEEFTPLCADVEPPYQECWSEVDVADHEGCHFYGNVSIYFHAPPVVWTGACRDGRTEGEGVLQDKDGHRAEGRFVEGLKDGSWKVTLADGRVVMESHVDGVFHGQWTFAWSGGRFYTLQYKNGSMEGPWERRDDDGYSMTGTVNDGWFEGIVTITWANGVEALVHYEDDRIHGEVTVTRYGRPLGTLLYWKGRHVDGILDPLPIIPDDP